MQEFLRRALSIEDGEALRELAEGAKITQIQRGSMLIRAGEAQTCVWFVRQGILRGFLIDRNGRDITDCFMYRRGDVVMSCNGLGGKALINIEAMTDSSLVRLQTGAAESLVKKYPAVYIRFLTDALERHWEAKAALHQCAQQRYQWFLEAYPGLIDVITNRHIASFLGITPVTLSRVRRQQELEEELEYLEDPEELEEPEKPEDQSEQADQQDQQNQQKNRRRGGNNQECST